MTKTDIHKESLPVVAEVSITHENAIITRFVASRKYYLYWKRAFDITFSLLAIILVLSWLLPIIAVWIKLDSKGPVFFSQKRIGRNGVLFRCLKFRTMVINNEADERPAGENDERITKTGRFLRQTNMDELPQLFNVLIGDMSLTGPRPHMLSDCMRFSFVISSYKFRSLVKPGITGLAQVKGFRGEIETDEDMINRIKYDVFYIENWSFIMDLKIIFQTIINIFKGEEKAY